MEKQPKKMMLIALLFALTLLLRIGRARYHFAINLQAQEDDANCFTLCTNFAAKKREYKVPFPIDLEAQEDDANSLQYLH